MAEKLHRLSNVGGAPRRNRKAAIDSVAEYSSATERGMRVLMEAQNYWNSMDQFRRDRQRNKNYTYGRQWDDVICVDGHRMREEDYIKSQGNVALKNNLIRKMVRSILGLFKTQALTPVCVARDRDEQQLGETMTVTLECNMNLNKMRELHARSMEEFLISGFVVHRNGTVGVWSAPIAGPTTCSPTISLSTTTCATSEAGIAHASERYTTSPSRASVRNLRNHPPTTPISARSMPWQGSAT